MSVGPGSVAPTTRNGEPMTAVNEFEGALPRGSRCRGCHSRVWRLDARTEAARTAAAIGQGTRLEALFDAAAQQAGELREAVHHAWVL